MSRQKPHISSVRVAAESRLFRIETVHLEFDNGRTTEFERMGNARPGGQAVVIVPLAGIDSIFLVREYAVGVEEYVLRLPQGLSSPGESPAQTANRELMEEVGYAARRLRNLGCLNLLPNCLPYQAEVVLADGLYPGHLDGDEPEPLEVIRWPIARLRDLVTRGEITEACSLAALFVAQEHLQKRVL